MHDHLTNPQLLVGGFALLLTIIFALAAMLESHSKRPLPFRSFLCTGFDRGLFGKDAVKSAPVDEEDENLIFSDIDAAYLDSLGIAANARASRRVNLK